MGDLPLLDELSALDSGTIALVLSLVALMLSILALFLLWQRSGNRSRPGTLDRLVDRKVKNRLDRKVEKDGLDRKVADKVNLLLDKRRQQETERRMGEKHHTQHFTHSLQSERSGSSQPARLQQSRQQQGRRDRNPREGDDLAAQYNDATSDPDAQKRFKQEHDLLMLETQNAMERKENKQVSPVFGKGRRGDYIAVKQENQSRHTYLVFPRFGLTLNASIFGPGAMREVFKVAEEIQPNARYRDYTVEQPARFAHDPGEGWTLKEPGRLSLGSPS